MKARYLSLLLAILPLSLPAQTLMDGGQPQISVNGHAERMVAPDLMSWNLQVRTQGAEVAQVAETQRQRVAAVLEYIKEAGLPEKKVQTAHMQLQENWEYRNGTRYRNGYFAETTILFESKDLDLYDTLWLGLSELEGLSVNNVSLTLDDPREIRNQVRLEALKAARDKARAMASALDCSIGDVLVISEMGGGGVQPMANVRMMSMDKAESGGSAMSPGEIEVSAEVQVAFGLLNRR